jgi:imidazolonepropionase-like amidohydrolase
VDDLLIRDVAVLDCTGRQPGPRLDVLVRAGRIAWIRPPGEGAQMPSARVIDGAGCTLMPGLTDAHVHFAIIGKGGWHGDLAWIEHVLRVAGMISEALDEGFTTVRDAGGLEPTWARMVAEGKVRGPRILPSGSFISQTGGHGDDRLAHEAVHRGVSIPGLVAMNEIVDGVDAVRRAAREQLRRGATQVKMFASGGLASPTDPLEGLQFSVDEIRAAVEVAHDWGTYVLAHCHTSPAIQRALDGGVRSIEHASMLDEATAQRLAREEKFVVPTLQVLVELLEEPERFGLTPAKQARAERVYRSAQESIKLAGGVGVSVGSGSDLVGPEQHHRGRELVLKAGLMGAEAAIISATRTNALLFRMEDRIGTVEPGKEADLILVSGEPLADIGILADPSCIPVVIRGGEVMKDSGGRVAA